MSIYFVTGTDTDVGKTIVTAALAAVAVRRGRTVAVVKPAQTGVSGGEDGDLAVVRRLAGKVRTYDGARLPHPLAPDRAALVSGQSLPTLAEQRDLVLTSSADSDVTLVEGAGGVTVNLGDGFGLLGLASALTESGCRVDWIVVARAGLGTLNHTKLTVDAITRAGFSVQGVVIGSWPNSPGLAELHNRDDLSRYSGVPLLGSVPEGSGRLEPEAFSRQAPDWIPYASL
ncbi:MAG: dethiobiotin synthase [Nocardioidaceae bacterium]